MVQLWQKKYIYVSTKYLLRHQLRSWFKIMLGGVTFSGIIGEVSMRWI